MACAMSGEELMRDAVPWIDGFPRPDWDEVWRRLEATASPGETVQAVCVAERFWLSQLAKALGGAYGVVESTDFLLLTEQPEDASTALLTFAQGALVEV